ncbi:MAG: S41 family peptidase [Peptostreptococcaceae bacterium]|nr:S41 family peptidase [Peptostreptococcaceae bacterium]
MNDKKVSRKGTIILAFVTGVVVALASTFVFFSVINDYVAVDRSEIESVKQVIENLGKYYEIDNQIENKSIYKRDEDEYKDDVCRAMMALLDDKYARYYSIEEYGDWKQSLESSYSGIGITYSLVEEKYMVIEVAVGSPAESVGLIAGDNILEVDGKTYDDINAMSENIMGEAGTEVTLTIERDKKVFDLTIIRSNIDTKTVTSEVLDSGEGYIKISSFGLDTADEFQKTLLELKDKKVERMVIDLRNNPGGLVSTCVDIADMLLPECKVLVTKDKNDIEDVYNSDTSSTDIKYVILVNEHSASASEIMSAAVQDNKGGLIIGTQTYGKGVVQENIELSDGSAIKFTTMEYFSPDGDVIDKVGVTPDVVITDDEDTDRDEQLEKAIELLAK